MQKPTDNSLKVIYNAAWPAIPAAPGRACGPYRAYAPHAQCSAIAHFGACKDSPQRSAGSFNILHPKRKALISADHRLISWEDKPLSLPIIDTGSIDIHLQSSDQGLFEPGTNSVDLEFACIASAAEVMSTVCYSGSGLSLTTEAPPEPGEGKELNFPLRQDESSSKVMYHRGVSAYGGLAVVCEREDLDLLSFIRQGIEPKSLTMLDEESLELPLPSSMPRPLMQSFAHTGSTMGRCSRSSGSCGAPLKPCHGGNIEGDFPLVRSCSLSTLLPPTSNSYEVDAEQRRSSSSITASSSISSRGVPVQGRKRSFSANELSCADLSSSQEIQPHKMQARKQRQRQRGVIRTTDPQSISAARRRKEKLGKKIKILQSLVPNGERLDTVSMLGQTLEYIRFLQYQLGELHDQAPDDLTASVRSSNWNKWKPFMDSHSATSTSSSTITIS